ncbi:IS110 family transposase [Paenibacillus hamazuiensis]|uniref:IS110 family transposase n=1 Tax=Paenibacillus hamazuiensis TaxID=2936508 RepID=UPI00200C676E|nr:IS110 family transposase [Paenibacillus hamazuiensis]
MPSILFVGIDVSSKNNVVCCLPEGDVHKPLSRFTVTNDEPGVMIFQERIKALMSKHGLTHIRFGLEATGPFSSHLARYLQSVLTFEPYEHAVYVFNPSLIKEFKKAHFLYAPKNDRVDAWFIAAKLRSGHLPRAYTWSESMAALQRLTRTRFHVVHTLTRETNFLLTNLFLKFSSYASGPFRHKTSATSLAVIEEFASVEDIIHMSVEDLMAFVMERGRNQFENPEEVALALQKAARSSYRLPKAMADAVNFAMASNIRIIRSLQEQAKSLQKAIEDHLASIPQTLTSVPGMGPIFAAGILSEIGDIGRFPSHMKLAKYAGLAWTENQSGNFKGVESRLIKSGNRYLKYYFTEAAKSVQVHDTIFAQYYSHKKAEPAKYAEKRALALTARKLVRLVDHLLRTNRLYEPQEVIRQEA